MNLEYRKNPVCMNTGTMIMLHDTVEVRQDARLRFSIYRVRFDTAQGSSCNHNVTFANNENAQWMRSIGCLKYVLGE